MGIVRLCEGKKASILWSHHEKNVITRRNRLCNVVVYVWNKIISKLFQPWSTSDWNNFISARGNLPGIISKLFQQLIAAHEYFPACSMSL